MKLSHNSENLPLQEGVREGDTISPWVNDTSKTEWDNAGIKIDSEYLNILRVTDGIVFLGEAEQVYTENDTRIKQMEQERRPADEHEDKQRYCEGISWYSNK